MDKNVYIVGDLPITLTKIDYLQIFSEEERIELENGKEIDWIGVNGEVHKVRLINEVNQNG